MERAREADDEDSVRPDPRMALSPYRGIRAKSRTDQNAGARRSLGGTVEEMTDLDDLKALS